MWLGFELHIVADHDVENTTDAPRAHLRQTILVQITAAGIRPSPACEANKSARWEVPAPKYVKPERVWLKTHPDLSEKWLQDRIGEDPSLLGLGDLVLRDRERPHAGAGRLDLLLQDAETSRRYEVEIQLGKTDESHIIRTIEYWDIERKRYPQYDHVAVIVAEDITSRFLNVIGLFNGYIPLVAIQLSAIQVGDTVSLVFSKVIDEMRLGLVDEDEEVRAPADRSYWEKRSNKQTLAMADEVFGWVHELDPDLELKYNKFYIGLAKGGRPNNFVSFVPRKDWLLVVIKLERSDETQAELEASGLDVMDYDARWGQYRIRVGKSDLAKHKDLLVALMTKAHEGAE
jgi:predicted transport protein